MNSKKLKKMQTAFRLYLRNFIIDQKITVAEFADSLGVSKGAVEKWLSKTTPCTAVSSFHQLVKFAELRDISVQHFCSILMGGRNEIGEQSSFAVEIADLLAGLENETQLVIHKAVKKQPAKLEARRELIKDILEASPSKAHLYEEIKNFDPDQVKNLLSLIKGFKKD